MIQQYNIRVNILPANVESVTTFRIRTNVIPADTLPQTLRVDYPFQINPIPIPINLTDPIKNTAFRFLRDILNTYIDEDRELKTLLNFGDDKQNVVLARRFGEILSNGDRTLQLKLLRALPDEVGIETPAFISREVANTLIDKFRVRFAPPIDASLYLRPKNTGITINDELGKSLRNVTLQLLSLETGSIGGSDGVANKTFEDQIYRRWYSYDFDSAELNLEFDDYSKFVFYGSAAMRVASFAEKLRQLEILNERRKQFDGNIFTGELASAGAKFILEQSSKTAKEIEDTIRSFDRYEQYLYFTPSGSISPYSASFDFVEDGIEFNEIGYWPKLSNGELYPVTSSIAQNWLATQIEIAQRYDEFNENNLINTIPTHIREDEENAPYFTFIAMVGHFFDLIKPYIDQFPFIYSRYIDPNEELSKDLIAEIAEAVGFKMPALNSIYELNATFLGTDNTPPLRDFTAQTYKRLLHNLTLFAKSKGTKTALTTALRSLGINQQLIDVGESGLSTTGSYYVFDEFTNGVDFRKTSNGMIKIPLSASLRLPTPRSILLDVKLPEATNSTLLTGDDSWALNAVVHPTNSALGRFELVSGSNGDLLLKTDYYEMFDNQPFVVSLNTAPNPVSSNVSLRVIQTADDMVLYDSIDVLQGTTPESINFLPSWNNTQHIYVGGSGSVSTGTFAGIVDEVRLWGLNLSADNTLNYAFNPNQSAGNLFTHASDLLYVQLSFNKIDGSLLPTSIINETPYTTVSQPPSLETIEVMNIDETSFVRFSRSVREYLPQLGTLGYITQKIKIAPPATFDDDGVKRLSRFKSVVSNRKTRAEDRNGNTVIMASSPTRIINQNIVRTFGDHNIRGAVGFPPRFPQLANSLKNLQNYYNRFYYVDVNPNKFIRTLAPVHGIIDQIVSYFIPSRASLINGIVIEPNVFEKTDIPILRKLRFYGGKTRRTIDAPGSLKTNSADYEATFNLEQRILAIAPGDVTASYNTKDAEFDLRLDEDISVDYANNSAAIDFVNNEPSASLPTYTTNIDADKLVELDSNISNLTSTIELDDAELVQGRFDNLLGKLDVQQTDALIGDNLSIVSNIDARDILDDESVTGTIPSVSASITIEDRDLTADYKLLDLQHLDWLSYQRISRSYTDDLEIGSEGFPIKQLPLPKLAINLGYDRMNKFKYNDVNLGSPGAEPYNRVYARKLFEYEINQPRLGGITSLNTKALYDIKPSADFNDIGSYTYFNNPEGIYYFPEIRLNPTYPQTLNAEWDFDSQTFITGGDTWQQGQRYKLNDVVLQDIDKNEDLGEDFARNARAGNGKYYVYTTRPAYAPPEDGSTFYLNDIPSFVPPSLDGTNWTRLRFKPTKVLVPKRIIFDTFTISEPRLNNFNTTIIDIETIVDEYTRFINELTIDVLPSNGVVQGELKLQNIAALLAMQSSNNNVRVRLYRTPADRDNDINRSSDTLPTGSHGVLLDTTLPQANTLQLINPIVTLVSEGIPPSGTIFYTINNLLPQTRISTRILFYYFTIEVQRQIPLGYLRKHYRFFRDNATATKRRNFLGCKNTIETTIDGQPPVQVFIGEGTELRVAPTTQNTEIITGGGGTLTS